MNSFNEVLTQLVAVWQAANIPALEVWDGEPYDPQLQNFLAVGWDQTDQPSVTLTSALGDYGASVDWDLYEISSLLSCWAGNQTPSQLRATAQSLLDSLRGALQAALTLNGTVLLARMSAAEFLLDKRPEGLLAQIRFTVTAQVG